MDSFSCDIYQLSSLLCRRSLGRSLKFSLGSVSASRYQEQLYSWFLSCGGVSPSYRLCMYYLPSVYFLLLISVSRHHLNLPLTTTSPLLGKSVSKQYNAKFNFICAGMYHHHDDVRLARISLTLSFYVSLSFIASGRSSGLHPVSSHSCCMNVRAGRPAFDWPYAGVHRLLEGFLFSSYNTEK